MLKSVNIARCSSKTNELRDIDSIGGSPTHRHAIEEESKVANRDWVDHQEFILLQYINVIANLFKLGNYFNELR